jgi:hypothetical protein
VHRNGRRCSLFSIERRFPKLDVASLVEAVLTKSLMVVKIWRLGKAGRSFLIGQYRTSSPGIHGNLGIKGNLPSVSYRRD